MKRKSRDWDLTLELSCHAGCPTGDYTLNTILPSIEAKNSEIVAVVVAIKIES
jgi:hypothetical protein